MAEGDIDYLITNNIDCTFEDVDGNKQRGTLNVEPQIARVLTESKTGLITAPFSQDFVFQKKGWGIRQVASVVSGSTQYYLVDLSGYGKDVFCLPVRLNSSYGIWGFTITTDFTYTVATVETPIFNRYGLRVTGNNLVKIYETITDLVVNSEPAEYSVGTDATNQAGGGGVSAGDQVWLMEYGYTYLMSFKNVSGEDTSTLGIQFDFYEV